MNIVSKAVSISLLAAVTLFPRVEPRAGLSEAAVLFLTIANSPKANAMGTCSINRVTPESSIMNPGALGVFHLDRLIAVSFPSETQWLPTLAGDLAFRTQSYSAGVSTAMLRLTGGRLRASLGLAYSRQELDLGEQIFTDEFGNVVSTVDAFEDAKYYTASLGVDYYVKVGAGFTHKEILSKLGDEGAGQERGLGTAEGTATDVGLYVEAPILDFVSQDIYLDPAREYPVTFDVTPSFAYVRANSGDDISYIDVAQADPLPHLERIGVALYIAAHVKDAAVISGRITWQENRALVGSPQKSKGTGAEIGLLNAFYYRWGNFKDPAGALDIKTSGYGFSLTGLISALGIFSHWTADHPWLRYLHEHVDLTYDSAEFKDEVNGPTNGTKFVKVGLSF